MVFICSVVIEVRNTTIGGDLGVDVATLLLVEIDLSLEDVDLLGLALELRTEEVLLHLDVSLFFLVLIIEDILVVAIQLTVQLQLCFTKILNHVEQVGIEADRSGKFTLCTSQICLSLFLLVVASLRHLVKLGL